MSKNNKKKVKMINLNQKKDASFWFVMFALAIMIFGTIGFSMSGSGTSSSDGTPSEIPFQEFEQDGVVFWGAIRNSEQFVFQTIEGYDGALVESGIANKLKQQEMVNIYVDDGFNESSAVFLIEKALRGIKINSYQITELDCSSNTLVFTTNTSFSGECIKFISVDGEAYNKAQIITYHLIK
jgi:hypothetical protein